MATPNKRRIEGLAFAENDAREVEIKKGFLEESIMVSGAFTDTISVAATSARTRGTPIRAISLVSDGGSLLHTIRPHDLIAELEIFEQTALGLIVAPPTGTGVGAQTGTFDLTLMFKSSHADDALQTAFPSWIYDATILRIDWGGHAQLYVGGTGAVTMQSLSVMATGVQEDFSSLGNPFSWGRDLRRLIRGYKEVALPGAAQTEFTTDIPRTSDIRAIMLVTEDANGTPVNTVLNAVTLRVNGQLSQFSRVPGRALRGDNAKTYGVTMPPGVYVLDFAEDRDIQASEILLARRMTALELISDVAAVAGTLRIARIAIEPGPGQTQAAAIAA